MSEVKAYAAYFSRKLYLLALILTALWCVFIFVMSAMPAPVSAEQSGSIAEILTPIFVSGFDGLDSAEQTEILLSVDHVVRKATHFGVYAVLGVLFSFVSLRHPNTFCGHWLISWLRGTLYAASDELHQAFVPGRGARLSDVLLDSSGVLFGALFALLFTAILLKRKS